jgi:TonB family protein
MKRCFVLPIILLCVALCAAGEDKGHCPSPADIPKAARAERIPPKQTAPTAYATVAGIVYLQIVISDKGYVCSVQLVRGFDKTADAKAIQGARKWRFDPARKNGHPVIVEMIVEVAFRRNANGELVLAASNPAK